jgi:hypothetical protein
VERQLKNVVFLYQDFATDPDPAFHFKADPDPAFHFNADPESDLALHQRDGILPPLVYRPSWAPF